MENCSRLFFIKKRIFERIFIFFTEIFKVFIIFLTYNIREDIYIV